MAAPTPAATPRVPAGVRMTEGHPTTITLAADIDISFWETEVTPPGVDGGDTNDITTMYNTEWRTFAARVLKTLTEAGATVQYAPSGITQAVAIINVPTTVTIFFPGGATLAFYGYLRTFVPAADVEGAPPTATIAVQPTNYDPTTGTEEEPVLTIPVGLARKMAGLKGAEFAGSKVKVKRVKAGKGQPATAVPSKGDSETGHGHSKS